MAYLRRIGAVGLVEERPYLRLEMLPPGNGALQVVLLEAELARYLLVCRLLCVEVEPVQHGQGLLGVAMLEDQSAFGL